jgi:hypothetical protein
MRFRPTPLDVLVDSPVLAGRHFQRVELDEQVTLNIAADRPDLLPSGRSRSRRTGKWCGKRRLVRRAPFRPVRDAAGAERGPDPVGIEHHQSCEAVSIPNYFHRLGDDLRPARHHPARICAQLERQAPARRRQLAALF